MHDDLHIGIKHAIQCEQYDHVMLGWKYAWLHKKLALLNGCSPLQDMQVCICSTRLHDIYVEQSAGEAMGDAYLLTRWHLLAIAASSRVQQSHLHDTHGKVDRIYNQAQ